jgi:outer membrane protein assembly factor BamB
LPETSTAPAFRHDPAKSVLVLPGQAGSASGWDREPVVCGYQHLSHPLEQPLPVPVSASPAVVTGAGVIVGSYDGHVRFYDRTLSKVYWKRRMDGPVYASLILDPARRRVVVAATSGLVACFDLRGGLAWSAQTGVPLYATPTVLPGSDVLVLAGFRSRCIGLRLETGAEVFDRELPRPWHARHGGVAAYRDPYASPATTEADTAIVCCAEHVLCLAPDGTELWRHEAGHAIKASPAALHATGEVAVCPVDGRCLFLDSRTGQLRGEVSLGAKVTGSPAVSGRILAVGSQHGTVAGIDIGTREIAWTATQGAPREYSSFTVLPDGNFAATAQRGNVICLAREDGRFRWETSQVLGLAEHRQEMDTTPVTGPDGSMYCGSYSGNLYYFKFQPLGEECQS